MKFTYIEPEYKQIEPKIELELYRIDLLNLYVNDINSKIKLLVPEQTNKQKRKTRLYLSQLIMNINTNNTYQKKKIIVDDSLFIREPDNIEIMDFYRDINNIYNSSLFKNDEFDIKKTLSLLIKKCNNYYHKLNESKNIFTISKDGDYYIYILNDKIYSNYKTISKSYKLHEKIYQKLIKEYNGEKEEMEKYILCGILRYNALGSGANQYVHNLNYKELMHKEVGSDFECFASMFNHYYKNYCSMFYDIEKYFGSNGSFFGLTMESGVYHINPPYDENLLDKMQKHIYQNIKPGVIINAMIPLWKDFIVEKNMDKKALIKLYIKEKFMNPYTFVYYDIPPYIIYLYADIDINDIYTEKELNNKDKLYNETKNKVIKIIKLTKKFYKKSIYRN